VAQFSACSIFTIFPSNLCSKSFATNFDCKDKILNDFFVLSKKLIGFSKHIQSG